MAALAYGGRTGRAAVVVPSSLDGIEQWLPRADVILCEYPPTLSLLEAIYKHGNPAFTPGVICCDRAGEPFQPAAAPPPPRTPAQIVLFDGMPGTLTPRQKTRLNAVVDRVLRPETEADVLRRVLAGGADVLILRTHSDGVDAFLGDRLTLCALMGNSTDPVEDDRRPLCQTIERCFRHQIPLQEAFESARLLDPDRIAARVLVAATCWTCLAHDGVLDPNLGLLRRLLRNTDVHTVIAAPGMGAFSYDLMAALCEGLRSGKPLGSVVASVNRLDEARTGGVRLSLFGDPRQRFHSEPKRAMVSAARDRRAGGAARWRALKIGQSTFLAAMFQAALAKKASDRSLETLRLLGIYQQRLLHGLQPEFEASSLGDLMRRAALEALANEIHCSTFELWANLARRLRGEQTRTCTSCGLDLRVQVASMWDIRLPPRQIARSSRCGIVADVPAGDTKRFFIADETMFLHGATMRTEWDACVRFDNQEMSVGRTIWWLRDTDGSPRTRSDMPADLPPGPLTVSFFMLEGASLSVLIRRWRRNTIAHGSCGWDGGGAVPIGQQVLCSAP